MHQADAGGVEQIEREVLVGGDPPPVRRMAAEQRLAGSKDVERAFRHTAGQALDGIEPGHHLVATMLEGGDVPGEMKSCGPSSAATAAAWLMEEALVVECDWIADIALMSGFGPPA